MTESQSPLLPYGWTDWVGTRFTTPTTAAHHVGRVVRVERISCVVVTAHGERIATARPMPAVGDWVRLEADDGTDELRIIEIAERWSELARVDVIGAEQLLAVNIDLVFVTIPADRINPARAERELAMGWSSGAQAVALITKNDVAVAGEVDQLRERLRGTELVITSAEQGDGVDRVRQLLKPDQTAVFLGPSGAGKSSLANALIGDGQLATGAVREGDSRGRHTTSNRQLVVVPTGGVLIDVPGIRTVALASDGGGLAATFPEIDAVLGTCRFSNCSHDHEPGCEILAAVAAGDIDVSRLGNYLKLHEELRALKDR